MTENVFTSSNIVLSIIVPVKDIYVWMDNILNNTFLLKAENNEVEFIFVHSNEEDKSVRILKDKLHSLYSKCQHISFLSQNPMNSGIYGAMNTGLDYSKGIFLLFLGADDKLIPSSVLSLLDCLRSDHQHDIVLAEASLSTDSTKIKFAGGKAGRLNWLFGMPRCHQAIIYRKSFLEKNNIRYCTKIKVSSDYILTSEVFSCHPLVLTTDLVVVVYEMSGYSSKFSSFYLYLEHIRGYWINNRLRIFFIVVLFSRGILIILCLIKNIIKHIRKYSGRLG